MAAVKHSYFTLFIIFNIVRQNDFDIMLAVFYIPAYFALVFDRPESERLAYGNEFVLFSDEFIQTLFGFFVFRITRNYSVH